MNFYNKYRKFFTIYDIVQGTFIIAWQNSAFSAEKPPKSEESIVVNSQEYLSGRREGEFFYEEANFVACDKIIRKPDGSLIAAKDCKKVPFRICKKIIRRRDGSLTTGSTCMESCYSFEHKNQFAYSSRTII